MLLTRLARMIFMLASARSPGQVCRSQASKGPDIAAGHGWMAMRGSRSACLIRLPTAHLSHHTHLVSRISLPWQLPVKVKLFWASELQKI